MKCGSVRGLIFTDLDGTLLDDGYDLMSAAEAMNELSRLAVYTIPASSKTQAEMQGLEALLEYDTPLICENGAVVCPPQGPMAPGLRANTPDAAGSYAAIRSLLIALRKTHDFDFRGFGDMPVEEVSMRTGLAGEQAFLARQRMASEPIVWLDSSERLPPFREALDEEGLRLVQGGRFWHVMPPADKGRAAAQIVCGILARGGQRPLVIGCGDSANDIPMLEYADHAVLFPRRDGSYLRLPGRLYTHAGAPGAAGWCAAIYGVVEQHLLNQLGESQ